MIGSSRAGIDPARTQRVGKPPVGRISRLCPAMGDYDGQSVPASFVGGAIIN